MTGKILSDEIPGLQIQTNISKTRNSKPCKLHHLELEKSLRSLLIKKLCTTQCVTISLSTTSEHTTEQLWEDSGGHTSTSSLSHFLTSSKQSHCSRCINIHAGIACLGDGCMYAAASKDVCLRLCWASGSCRALQGHLFYTSSFLQTYVPSLWELWGREWQWLFGIHPWEGFIGYYSFQFGRAPRNISCRNTYSWNDLKITQWQSKAYIMLEDKYTEGIKHTTVLMSVSQETLLWWCYSRSRLYAVPYASSGKLLLPGLDGEASMPLENSLLVCIKQDPYRI